MAHEPIPVTDAEATVMEVLWQSSPRSSEDVVAAVAPATGWAEPTIKTLLNRLLKKGAVRAEKDGRRYRYHAVLRREDWVAGQSRGLLDRLFDGRLAPMVAHLSSQRALSAEDIAELRRLLEEIDDGQ